MVADYYSLSITFAKKADAVQLVTQLLDEKLIACANIMGAVDSIYVWQGERMHEQEVIALCKTNKHQLKQAITIATQLHSYECSSIVALPIEHGNAEYFAWIDEQLSK